MCDIFMTILQRVVDKNNISDVKHELGEICVLFKFVCSLQSHCGGHVYFGKLLLNLSWVCSSLSLHRTFLCVRSLWVLKVLSIK